MSFCPFIDLCSMKTCHLLGICIPFISCSSTPHGSRSQGCVSGPWSRDWAGPDHVAEHALITWLSMHWSRDWEALITWLRGTDYVTERRLSRDWEALITWLCRQWSRGWAGTDIVTEHALITWLRGTDHVTERHWLRDWEALITWLRGADHMTERRWSRGYHALITCFRRQ